MELDMLVSIPISQLNEALWVSKKIHWVVTELWLKNFKKSSSQIVENVASIKQVRVCAQSQTRFATNLQDQYICLRHVILFLNSIHKLKLLYSLVTFLFAFIFLILTICVTFTHQGFMRGNVQFGNLVVDATERYMKVRNLNHALSKHLIEKLLYWQCHTLCKGGASYRNDRRLLSSSIPCEFLDCLHVWIWSVWSFVSLVCFKMMSKCHWNAFISWN